MAEAPAEELDAEHTIVISGIPKQINKGYLEDALEEEVEQDVDITVMYENEGSQALVKLSKKDAITSLLSRQHIEIDTHKLPVSKFTPQVLVKGTRDIDAGRLKTFFTSRRRGGGENTVEKEIDDSQAVVTFQQFTAAANIVRTKKFEMRSGDETINLETEWHVAKDETPDSKRKSVCISGLKPNVHEDYLRDILDVLEDNHGIQLGSIENVTLNKENSSAVVEYDNIKAVDALTSLKSCDFDDMSLTFSYLEDKIEECNDDPQYVKQQSDGMTVLLTNIPGECDIDRLEVALGKKSIGGPVESVQIIAEQHMAIVKFENPENAAHCVNLGSFELIRQKVKAEWYLKPCGQEFLVLVENIEDLPKDFLEDIFENESVSGGGEFSELLVTDDGTAIVKFKQKHVAERVASMGEIKYGKYTLRVRLHTENIHASDRQDVNETKSNAVVLKGEDIPLDRIKLFMENPRRINGGPVKDVYKDKETNNTIVEFKDFEVAERVASNHEITIGGLQVTVSLKSILKAEEYDPSSTVIVKGLMAELDEETCIDLFENKKKTDGGRVKRSTLSDDKCSITIVFEKTEDAQRVLKKGDIQFSKFTLTCIPVAKPRGRAAKTKAPETETNYPIEVSNIDKKITKEYLQLFLESKSGGVQVERISHNKQEGRAVVILKDLKGTEQILSTFHKKGFKMSGNELYIQKLDLEKLGPGAMYAIGYAVKVTDIPTYESREVCEEVMRLLFESESESGGGPIEEIYIDTDITYVILTFQSPEVAERVVAKHMDDAIMTDGHKLQVHSLQSAGELQVFKNKDMLEKKMVFIQNLPDDINSGEMKLYIEAHANASISSTVYGIEPGSVLIEFHDDPDFDRLFQYLRGKPLHGNMIGFKRVPRSSMIEVYAKDSSITDIKEQHLRLNFESQRNGGDKIIKIEKLKEYDVVVITYESPEVSERVSHKTPHYILGGKELSVKIHHSCIGILPPGHDSTQPISSLPTDMNFNIPDCRIWNFICQNQNEKKKMAGILQEQYAKAEFAVYQKEGSIPIMCILTKDVDDYQYIAKNWESKTNSAVNEFLNEYSIYSITSIPVDIQNEQSVRDLETDLRENFQANCQANEWTIIGLKENVRRATDKIEEVFIKARQERERRLQTKVVTMSVEVMKLKLLECNGFPKKMKEKNNVCVSIYLEIGELSFTGMEQNIIPAQMQAMQEINDMKIKELPKHYDMLIHFKKVNVMKQVQDKLDKNSLVAIIDVSSSGVLVCSAKFRSKEICSIVDSSVNEKEIPLKNNTKSIIGTKQWVQEKENIHVDYGDVVEMKETTKHIQVIALADITETVFKRIKNFLEEHAIKQHFLTVEAGRVKLVKLSNNLSEVMDKLTRKGLTGQIDPVLLNDKAGFNIEGSKEYIENVIKELQIISANIKEQKDEIHQPGMAPYITSDNGKLLINSLEIKHQVAIEVVPEKIEDDYVVLSAGKASSAVASASPSADKVLSFFSTADPSKITTVEGISVSIVKGEMAKQKVDVIVNTTSADLQLHQGAVSSSLLEYGGQILQTECDRIYDDNFQQGDIADTTGGKLNCKRVYHGSIQSWEGGDPESKKIMKALINNCLDKADAGNFRSIAFPAAGTGNLAFPKEYVAKVMYKLIHNFSKANRNTSVKTIYFVLYHKDQEAIQAFETESSRLLKNTPVTKSKGSLERTIAKKKRITTTKAALPTNFDSEIKIGAISIQVVQGDITDEDSEVIINSSNDKLEFISLVSIAILEKGGQEIEEECKKSKMRDGLAITDAGRLNCKRIIHINAPSENTDEWKDIIIRFLRMADKHKIKSLSMPALGTGQVGNSPATMAYIIMDAIAVFSNEKPRFLHEIRVVVYDESMMSEFKAEFVKIASSATGQQKGFTFKKFVGKVMGLFGGKPPSTGIDHIEEEFSDEEIDPFLGEYVDLTRWFLRVFSFDKTQIPKVFQEIQRHCKQECEEKVIDGTEDAKRIKQLTEEQLSKIKRFKHKHQVKIEFDKDAGKIVIQGMKNRVTEVFYLIREMLMEVDKTEEQARREKELFLKVKWQYKQHDKYKSYPENINFIIEDAYRDQLPKVTWMEINSQEEEVDYEINFSGRGFKETQIGDSYSAKTVRRFCPDSVELPKDWKVMNPSETVHVEPCKKGSREYERIFQKFKDNKVGIAASSSVIPEVQIKMIGRIQNPGRYKTYMIKKAEIEETLPQGTPVERELWHGTSIDTIEEINVNGFNRSFCGKNATRFGNGVYFAVTAHYSHDYTDEEEGVRRMYFCRVLTGTYVEGEEGMKVPPSIDPSRPSVRHNSVVDDLEDPNMFVIFSDEQAYPEYLITYTSS